MTTNFYKEFDFLKKKKGENGIRSSVSWTADDKWMAFGSQSAKWRSRKPLNLAKQERSRIRFISIASDKSYARRLAAICNKSKLNSKLKKRQRELA